LLDAQVVGSDGRYEFLDVEIFFGNNVFRIVSYGPQGQVQEEVKTFRIDSSMLAKGQLHYETSVDEKSRTLFGVDEEGRSLNHGNTPRFASNLEYGLLGNTTLNMGVVRTPLSDGRVHHYQKSGVRNSFGNIFTNLDFVNDWDTGGWASELTIHTAIKGVNVKFEQQNVSNFFSEIISNSLDPTDSTMLCFLHLVRY
jgi:hypothetical protein